MHMEKAALFELYLKARGVLSLGKQAPRRLFMRPLIRFLFSLNYGKLCLFVHDVVVLQNFEIRCFIDNKNVGRLANELCSISCHNGPAISKLQLDEII